MINLPVIASVGQLVTNASTALKLVWKALKGFISKRKRLEIENRSLKDQLARNDEIVGPIGKHGYFFYNDKPDQPLCPKCFQSQPPIRVYLRPIEIGNGGNYRDCLNCYCRYYETPEQQQPPIRMGRPNVKDISLRRY